MQLVGRPFDPRLARVVGTAPDRSVAEGTVIEEVRAGFLWDDQVLRTAEVIVSKGDNGIGERTMTDEIVGIDLGTTNSEIAHLPEWSAGGPWRRAGTASSCPRWSGFPKTGDLLVGEEARNQFLLYPERTVRSIKRRMGSDAQVQPGGARLHAARDLGDHPVAAEGDRRSAGWDGRSARR